MQATKPTHIGMLIIPNARRAVPLYKPLIILHNATCYVQALSKADDDKTHRKERNTQSSGAPPVESPSHVPPKIVHIPITWMSAYSALDTQQESYAK